MQSSIELPHAESVRSGVALTDADRQNRLQSILSKSLLPSPPALAMQIVERASDPNCEIAEIAGLLGRDPTLCAKLLQIANSVMYSPTRRITTIKAAVMMLGLNRLRSLVLGMSIAAMQTPGKSDPAVTAFWRSSVSGAILTREFAALLRDSAAEDVMTAALLRDLGIILLQQSFPTQYEPVWSGRNRIYGAERCRWEANEFGFDHAEVGAALLQSWRLPDPLVEFVRHHHEPDRLPNGSPQSLRRARTLNFASRLAELDECMQSADACREIYDLARDSFELDAAGLERFLTDVTPKVEEFASILSLNIGDSPKFAAVLSNGYQELLRLSVAVVAETPVAATQTKWVASYRVAAPGSHRDLGVGWRFAIAIGFVGACRSTTRFVFFEHSRSDGNGEPISRV